MPATQASSASTASGCSCCCFYSVGACSASSSGVEMSPVSIIVVVLLVSLMANAAPNDVLRHREALPVDVDRQRERAADGAVIDHLLEFLGSDDPVLFEAIPQREPLDRVANRRVAAIVAVLPVQFPEPLPALLVGLVAVQPGLDRDD